MDTIKQKDELNCQKVTSWERLFGLFTWGGCPPAAPASASWSRRSVYSGTSPLSALSCKSHTSRPASGGRWGSAEPRWRWWTAPRLPSPWRCRGCMTRKGGGTRPRICSWRLWRSRASASTCKPALSPRPGGASWSGSSAGTPPPAICRCWALPCSASSWWWGKCPGSPRPGRRRCLRGGPWWWAPPESGACWTRSATGCRTSGWGWTARAPACGSPGCRESRSAPRRWTAATRGLSPEPTRKRPRPLRPWCLLSNTQTPHELTSRCELSSRVAVAAEYVSPTHSHHPQAPNVSTERGGASSSVQVAGGWGGGLLWRNAHLDIMRTMCGSSSDRGHSGRLVLVPALRCFPRTLLRVPLVSHPWVSWLMRNCALTYDGKLWGGKDTYFILCLPDAIYVVSSARVWSTPLHSGSNTAFKGKNRSTTRDCVAGGETDVMSVTLNTAILVMRCSVWIIHGLRTEKSLDGKMAKSCLYLKIFLCNSVSDQI